MTFSPNKIPSRSIWSCFHNFRKSKKAKQGPIKFDKLTEKIQQKAIKLKNLNFDKYIGKYEQGINLQNKINDIIDDQIYNIQAYRERMKICINESNNHSMEFIRKPLDQEDDDNKEIPPKQISQVYHDASVSQTKFLKIFAW